MGCGCGGSAPAASDAKFEVRLPDGTVKTVTSEANARIEITMAGGGTFSRV